jgi:hypothetical protein
MSEQQGKELLSVMGEVLLELRLVNEKIENIEREQRYTNERLTTVERRLDTIELRLEGIERDTSAIKRVVHSHEQRLKTLEHE